MREATRARGSEAYAEERARIEAVLGAPVPAFAIAYQPIVDIRRGAIVGVEALSRFSVPPERTPDRWFEEAWDVGVGLELELLAIERALEKLPELPDDVYIAVNTDPRTLVSAELARLIRGSGALHRVVLELTEHAAVEDYDRLNAALAPLRASGARLAIDDAGAGFASLQHVLRLRPDIIKLDRSITQNIEDNPVRAALIAGLVFFAASLDAVVCAEGVETERQLVALQRGGVGTAQGFFLARPGPLPLPLLPPPAAFRSPPHTRQKQDTTPAPLGQDDDAAFDRLARIAAKALAIERGEVTLLGDRRGAVDRAPALGQHIVASRLPLVLADVHRDPVARELGVAEDPELGAYLGVPIVTREEVVLGSLSVHGPAPRAWTAADLATMKDLARLAVDLLEGHRAARVDGRPVDAPAVG